MSTQKVSITKDAPEYSKPTYSPGEVVVNTTETATALVVQLPCPDAPQDQFFGLPLTGSPGNGRTVVRFYKDTFPYLFSGTHTIKSE